MIPSVTNVGLTWGAAGSYAMKVVSTSMMLALSISVFFPERAFSRTVACLAPAESARGLTVKSAPPRKLPSIWTDTSASLALLRVNWVGSSGTPALRNATSVNGDTMIVTTPLGTSLPSSTVDDTARTAVLMLAGAPVVSSM